MYVRIELDGDAVPEPLVLDCDYERRTSRCATCRTEWIDPEPGPMTVRVVPPDSWVELGAGFLLGPGLPSPVLRYDTATRVAASCAGVRVERVDLIDDDTDEPVGGDWAALWAVGSASNVLSGGVPAPRCEGCGRIAGEFERPFAFAVGDGDADWVRVPGWRFTTLVRREVAASLPALGLSWFVAVPVPSR
jgi:hypothetical protein